MISRKVFLAGWLAMTFAFGASTSWSAEPRPFVARYKAQFYGMSGGILQFTLRRGDGPDQYIYESRAEPSFLGSFMVSDAARERSTMTVTANGVRPLTFFSDDGKKGDEHDSDIRFDWTQNRLTGRSEGKDFNEPLPERIQDHLSIQIAVIEGLLGGAELGEFSLIDGGEIKRYTYSKEGAATVKFKGKTLEAVIVRSQRSDSPGGRINRYWHAPELGSIPVRAERSREGKVDLIMELVDVKFSE